MKNNNMKIKRITTNHLKTLIFPLVMWLLFLIITTIYGNTSLFVSSNALDNIFRQSILSTFVGLAIAIPLSGGRWDFATGTIAILGAIIGGNIGIKISANPLVVLLSCVVVCIILALFEAVLYVFLRVPNMIVSLGVVMFYEALTQICFNGEGVRLNRYDSVIAITQSPYCYIVLAVVLVVVFILLEYTKFGYDTKSLGNNSLLSINSGVNEKKNIILTYILVGGILGVAALFNASKSNITPASNLSSTSLMFSSMGSVLVGLFLARFTSMAWGVWVGSFGMQIMTFGMVCTGIDGSIQTIVTGVVIVAIMAYTANQEHFVAWFRKFKKNNSINKENVV